MSENKPLLTVHNALFTLLTTGLVLPKALLAYRGHSVAINSLDLVSGLAVTLAFFWLGEYRGRGDPRVAWYYEEYLPSLLLRWWACVFGVIADAYSCIGRDASRVADQVRIQITKSIARPIFIDWRRPWNATSFLAIDDDDCTIQIFKTASSITSDVWECSRTHPEASNIIFSHAVDRFTAEQPSGTVLSWIIHWLHIGFDCAHRLFRGERRVYMSAKEIWLVYWSKTPTPMIDFVVFCEDGLFGTRPVYIFSPHPIESVLARDDFTRPRLEVIVRVLAEMVPATRVSAVFAPEPVASMYAGVWAAQTRILTERHPFFAGVLMRCTRETFRGNGSRLRRPARDMNELRLAVEEDIGGVASCYYAYRSAMFLPEEPFAVTPEHARAEAEKAVRRRQIWVAKVTGDAEYSSEIVCIVAVQRTSHNVAALTKVYTNVAWRRRGFAEALIHCVCEALLKERTSVTAFVDHDDPILHMIFRRAGFLGVNDPGRPDPWLEIGFDISSVQFEERGNWKSVIWPSVLKGRLRVLVETNSL